MNDQCMNRPAAALGGVRPGPPPAALRARRAPAECPPAIFSASAHQHASWERQMRHVGRIMEEADVGRTASLP